MGRFTLAWKAFWSILTDKDKADAWKKLQNSEQESALPTEDAQPAPTANSGDDSLHILAILQREARLVDYLQEDLSAYDDTAVGAVSRKIHDDCKHSLDKYLQIVPVISAQEMEQVRVPADYDPRKIRITGRPSGEPPFTGILQHKGWIAEKVELPARNEAQNPNVLCQAEVEI